VILLMRSLLPVRRLIFMGMRGKTPNIALKFDHLT
jgi:hypothetical protein